MGDYYEWIKAFHVISIISWMAGMLYLPRLFVYHCGATKGGEAEQNFIVMERKLIRYIINPAMIASIILGLMLAHIYGFNNLGISFYIKMSAVILLIALHGMFVKWHKAFANGTNNHSHIFYRVINEVVTVLMTVAVIMVVVKPF